MRPQRTRPMPPASTDDLLALLRACRLIDDEQLIRLSGAWEGMAPPAPHVAQLVQAGVLTPYQGEQVLAGRTRGLRLGPYRLLDRLDSGGKNRVFRAEHVLMNRLVALKVLPRRRSGVLVGPDPASSSRRADAMPTEVRALARLRHPNIVAAHDAAWLGGRLVLVLEYLEGVDLARLLGETGPLPITLVRDIVRQTALGLGYLHERGLVHRDVKPANLLLVREGPDARPVVKLIDLELACRTGAMDRVCGTVDYLAPERAVAGEPADIRADLYSLGCTAYHLLTGQVPFPGDSWTDRLLRHRLDEPTPLTTLRPEVPPDLAGIIARLMAREPRDRYPHPDHVLTALDASLPVAAPAEPAHRDAPAAPVRRWPGPWAVLLAVLAGCAVGPLVRLGVLAEGTGPTSPVAARAAIRVSGREEAFDDLQSAIQAASDGGVVTLHGRGPWRCPPLDSSGKALTLRAAGAERPLLERLDAPEECWNALLSSENPLRLEGLELAIGPAGTPAPLIEVRGAALTLRDCWLRTGDAPAISLRRGASLEMHRCRVEADRQAIAVELPAGTRSRIGVYESEIRVRDGRGPMLLAWAGEPAQDAFLTVELAECLIRAGRVLACRSVSGPIQVTSRRNRLMVSEQTSFAGYSGLPPRVSWSDREAGEDRIGPAPR